MYNLIVTGEARAWESKKYALEVSRLGEWSPESFKERYRTFSNEAIAELTSFPTLFAYETVVQQPARLGSVIRIRRASGRDFRFDFRLEPRALPIIPQVLDEIAWDLDIGKLEMNRTHWAIKDVDLFDVLREAHLVDAATLEAQEPRRHDPPRTLLEASPTVFSIPHTGVEGDLVSVMMPFDSELGAVHDAIRGGCKKVGLRCMRADDIWEETTVIQDVFNLIYRSCVVVVDLTGRNSNVLYETGLAHTLGRPVIPISQRGDSLPFDLAHHRTLFYEPTEEGLAAMQNKLVPRLRHLTS